MNKKNEENLKPLKQINYETVARVHTHTHTRNIK